MSTFTYSDEEFAVQMGIHNLVPVQETRPEPSFELLGPEPLKGSEVFGAIFGALAVALILGLCWGGVFALGFFIKELL